MIEIESIDKSFGEHVVFKDFSAVIQTGELVGFSGVSGCGKTTLLNMIGAIEPVDKGRILVDGMDISNRKNQLLYYREKVGFLFQNFALVDDKSVYDNLKMVRYRTNKTIEEVLEKVDLSYAIHQKVYQLSGGEQQRVALARLMLKSCDLILADEPTGSLDKDNAERVMQILRSLNEEGRTVIIVSHDEEIKKTLGRNIAL